MANIDPKKTVKISVSELESEIRKKAHELFVKRGGTHGNDLEDWLEAERIVKKQLKIK